MTSNKLFEKYERVIKAMAEKGIHSNALSDAESLYKRAQDCDIAEKMQSVNAKNFEKAKEKLEITRTALEKYNHPQSRTYWNGKLDALDGGDVAKTALAESEL